MARDFRVSLASDLAGAFAEFGVEYLFLGKGGAIVLGFPGTTQDVDVFPEKSTENGRKIVTALRSLGFEIPESLEAAIVSGQDFVQIKNGPFDVDLVFAPDGILSFEAARARRIVHENLPIASLRDIIASKRASGRQKDLNDLPLLEKFREEFERLHPQPLRSAAGIAREQES